MIAKSGPAGQQVDQFDQPDPIPFDEHPAKPILEGSKSSTCCSRRLSGPPAEAIVSLVGCHESEKRALDLGGLDSHLLRQVKERMSAAVTALLLSIREESRHPRDCLRRRAVAAAAGRRRRRHAAPGA
jgi:hypothetical protein